MISALNSDQRFTTGIHIGAAVTGLAMAVFMAVAISKIGEATMCSRGIFAFAGSWSMFFEFLMPYVFGICNLFVFRRATLYLFGCLLREVDNREFYRALSELCLWMSFVSVLILAGFLLMLSGTNHFASLPGAVELNHALQAIESGVPTDCGAVRLGDVYSE